MALDDARPRSRGHVPGHPGIRRAGPRRYTPEYFVLGGGTSGGWVDRLSERFDDYCGPARARTDRLRMLHHQSRLLATNGVLTSIIQPVVVLQLAGRTS